jgi:hypothetical protein
MPLIAFATLFVVAVGSASVLAQSSATTFTGTVDQLASDRDAFSIDISEPTRIDVTLDWSVPSADLNLRLKNPSGDGVARAAEGTRPEHLSFDATRTGTWKAIVQSQAGASSFSMNVTLTPLTAPDPEPSPEPTPEPSPSPTPEPTPPAPSGAALGVWSPANEGGARSLTVSQAVAIANRFDTIVALPGAFRGMADEMKAANPDLIILAYMNGTFAQETQGTAFPSTWYARDSRGYKVTSKNYGNFLMDPSSGGWIGNRTEFCRKLLAESGYDGCLLDMLGTAPLNPGYLTALPINPATGQVWTEHHWLSATGNIAAQTKTAVAPALVFGNGLGNGSRYFDAQAPARQILRGADGGIAESWIRSSSQGITRFRTEDAWKRDVDMLRDAQNSGDTVLVFTKVWTSGTQAQKDAWHAYALASFLLGTGGEGRFTFSYDRSYDPTARAAWWNIDIGRAVEAYHKAAGLYQRRFERGIVVVNPTTVSATITLPVPHVDLQGRTVTTLTMGPNTGQVLRAA